MERNNTEKKFLSVEEVAQLLGVTYQLIYRLVREGTIPASQIGKVYRINRDDLDEYLARTKTGAPQAVICAACDRKYSSRMTMKGECEECGKPICVDCWTRQKLRRCEEHQQ